MIVRRGASDVVDRYHLGLAAAAAAAGLAVVVVAVLGRRTVGRSTGGVLTMAVIATAGVQWSSGVAGAGTSAALVAGAFSCGTLLRGTENGLVGPLAVISAGAVWTAVPDTEAPVVLLAILAVVAVSGVGLAVITGDRIAVLAALGTAAWLGSAGRPEFVGALGCVGLLAWQVPVAVGRDRRVAALVVHTALALVAGRVVARWDRPVAAVGVAALLTISALVVRRLRVNPGAPASRTDVLPD